MIPVYQESELYVWDEEAADHPCRFVERYCKHFEGRHAGKPFLLLPWQRQLVRTLFGWKRRSTDPSTRPLRRFRELFLLTAKGAGKTPLLSAIGLYLMLMDGEASAHVISMASTSEQARFTFDAAKKYITQNTQLRKAARPTEHEIKGVAGTKWDGCKWTTISGTPTGRSGSKPQCIIADEVMEWKAVTAEAYKTLTANLFKRSQPLLLVATNAGEARANYAYELYERALMVREGEIEDDTLLPVIFETPEEMDWESEEAAKASNPSIGSVIQFADLRSEWLKAHESTEGQTKYRRLYLSQWPKTNVKAWLDMPLWEKACQSFDPATLKDAVVYDGLDLSLNNDLCAALFVYGTAERFYVDSHFWMPIETAKEHEAKHGVPYSKWAEGGHITLVKSPTIDGPTRVEIANHVLNKTKGHKVKAISYDRARSEGVIAILEAANQVCVPTPQGYSLTPGCEELDRRLREGSISIMPNPVLTFCAANTQVKEDERGNYWPVKPNSKGKYAGLRHAKIDGITALVTALVEARKHSFPAVRKMWQGTVALASTLTGKTTQPTLPTPRPLLPVRPK